MSVLRALVFCIDLRFYSYFMIILMTIVHFLVKKTLECYTVNFIHEQILLQIPKLKL